MQFAQNVAAGLFSVALVGFGLRSWYLVEKPIVHEVIVKPTFSPLTLTAPFYDQFTDDWESRWRVSHAKKADAEEEWAYVGQWSVQEPTVLKGIEGDKGLVVMNVAAHHAISAKLDEPLDNTDKTLVVQYEVKLQNGLDCGGAYMKLLKENDELHADEFSNASPYVIMFGPDKCGSTNKVHFIFKHKNPKTGLYEEKHLKSPPMAKITKQTTLYTLIVKPDQTFEIRIDGTEVKKGSLLEDFDPSVNPEMEIDDVNDKKPDDWVDEAKITDPDAKKPDDWDEDAPYEIADEEAKKPDDWLEDEPEYIPDPDSVKPEDWNDDPDEDGPWTPNDIPNPKCESASGCGPWTRPMKPNPAYKGQWTAPKIDNPAYKGPWAPRKVPNPDYYEDKTPANLEPIGAIGFELWTMTKDILFDNIYVGHSIEDAEHLQKATFDVKKTYEKKEEDASIPKEPEPLSEFGRFLQNPVTYFAAKVEPFMAVAQRDPVGAIKTFPDVVGAIVAVLVTVLAILGSLISLAAGPTTVPAAPAARKKVEEQAKKTTEKAEDAKEKVQEIAGSSSDSDNPKPRATRRTSKKA